MPEIGFSDNLLTSDIAPLLGQLRSRSVHTILTSAAVMLRTPRMTTTTSSWAQVQAAVHWRQI